MYKKNQTVRAPFSWPILMIFISETLLVENYNNFITEKNIFDFWFDLNYVSKVALKCLFDHQHAPVNILKKNTKAENRIYFIRVKCYVIFCWKIFRKKDLNTHIYVHFFFLLQSYLDLRQVGKKLKKMSRRCFRKWI